MTPRLKAHMSIMGANIIFGLNYSITKGLLPVWMKPLGLNVCRVGGSLIFFWLITLIGKREKVDRADMPRLVLAGLFGIAANQMLFLIGINYSTPIDAAIMMTSNPLLVMIIAAIVIREQLTKSKMAGLALGALGAIILILHSPTVSTSGQGHSVMFGNVLFLINSACYGIYLVLVKPLMQKYNSFTVLKWAVLYGAIVIVPFGFSDFMAIQWSTFTTDAWLALAFVVLLASIVSFALNVYALTHVNATTVSIYVYSQPVIATLFAIAIGRDTLSVIKVLSALLVFAGVYLVSKRAKVVA